MRKKYNSSDKIIDYDFFVTRLTDLCIETNYSADPKFIELIKKEISTKKITKLNKIALQLFLENCKIAAKQKLPICQDTGMSIFFVEAGSRVKLSDSTIPAAIQKAAANAFVKGYLRKSMVQNPLTRQPISSDNSPAFIHTDIVEGDRIKIWYMPKGGGSENVSVIKFMNPSDTEDTILNFVVEHIKSIGSKACPPYKLGICIGGSFDYCSMMSKKALIDEFADKDKKTLIFSEKIRKAVNELAIGPQGFGGSPTAVKVNVKLLPAHIAMLPVAVSVNCNAVRLGRIEF